MNRADSEKKVLRQEGEFVVQKMSMSRRMRFLRGFSFAALFLFAGAQTASASDLKEILNPKSGKVIYVIGKGGKNKNPGTKDKPMKNIDKAMAKAASGDTIVVAEGTFKGTFGVGFWEMTKAVKLYGGFNRDFSARNPVKHLTLLQPGPERFSKAPKKHMLFSKNNFEPKHPIVVDGFVFEQGQMNPYEKTQGKPEGVETGMMKVGAGSANPNATCVTLFGSDLTVSNNLFVNCANNAVRLKLGGNLGIGLNGKGRALVANNVIVASRMSAVEVYGTEDNAGEAEVHHNTILFTWSRVKDLATLGYGVEILTKVKFNIHDNLIAMNIGPGVNNQRFNSHIKMDNNLFFGNKKKDFWFNPSSNTDIRINADEFEDLELDSVEGNVNKQIKLPLDKAYFAGVIAASYSEKTDYNPDSSANQLRAMMGMNKRGKIKSKVSMFANRYPWKEALKLWGAIKGKGAQKD
ncbi:MAG: right-handed parallel beta-helix repeat-containing protein [Deltaproteobacteria bacterium]|nr:right-handed parallel beta-helix repeat-containing protein [Deltaproteobacteria bacterium]